MNPAKCALLLFVVCSIAFFGASACRRERQATIDPKSLNPGTEPQLLMFGGWRDADKGIFLAKSDIGAQERIYFALAKPNGEPVVVDNAPKIEINIGFNIPNIAGANVGGKSAQFYTRTDDSGKITKAGLYIAHSSKSNIKSQHFDLEPVTHTLHGWSSNDVYAVFSAEGKKVFMADENASTVWDIKLQNITSFHQVALAGDKRGFYIVGDTALPGFGIEYVDFNKYTDYFKRKTQSFNILNVPRPKDAQATYRALMSPDQKTLALLTNTQPVGGEGDFHPEAQNKLSLYDLQTRQLTREYELPRGAADLKNMLFVSGPWWRADNRAIGFDLRPAREQKTFYTIDLSTGEITNWFTSGNSPK
ncbi:MAG TPA: hypothetical protein VF599_09670 [Pyrinomonadaceae bacterium]|jgi:hypothetical protein